MNLPVDVLVKAQVFGHVDLEWIGSHELSITVGTGGLLVCLVDHSRDSRVVVESVHSSIGSARASFTRYTRRAVAREVGEA